MTTPWLSEGMPHIWLPYTQMHECVPPLVVASAAGSELFLDDGRVLIDGISSWWSVCHGYQHPHIVKSIQKQAESLSHVMFGGLAHEQAYVLARRLTAITPAGLNRVFFSDSGSTAVEVAMKMAVQYWSNQGVRSRNKFICFMNSYHGDTMGAMSLTDPIGGMHKIFNSYMPQQYAINLPRDEYEFAEFVEMLDGLAPTTAAIIIEPLVQGAGGMKFHSPDVLAEIYRITKQHDLLFIADEIATGFYRTGMRFACDEAGISPDILCIGKALTGGHIGLGATIASEAIYEAFLDESPQKALMHGPTFMANPIACAAANASLDLFEAYGVEERISNIEQQLHEELKICRRFGNVRVTGAVGVIQIEGPKYAGRQELRRKFIEHNVWIRPLEDVVYLMPPFCITEQQLTVLTTAIREVLERNV